MPAPSFGSVTLISIIGSGNDQNTITNLYYWMETPWDNIQEMETYYNVLWAQIDAGGATDLLTQFRSACSNQWGIWNVKIQVIFPERYAFKAYPVNYLGTNVGPLQHQNVCSVITKQAEKGGRRYTGRWRLPGLPSGASAGGFLTDPQMAILDILADKWTTPIAQQNGAGTLYPVIYHPKAINMSAYDVIKTYVVHKDVRTQRTRNKGIGI